MEAKLYETLEDLLLGLQDIDKDVVRRRFGLHAPKETLQEIGDDYGVTRERIRQIQNRAMDGITPKAKKHIIILSLSTKARQHLGKVGVKREKTVTKDFARTHNISEKGESLLAFLILLSEKLHHHEETNEMHSFISASEKQTRLAKHVLKKILAKFASNPEKTYTGAEVLSFVEKEIHKHIGVKAKEDELYDFLRILKPIGRNPFGQFGLLDHNQITPSSLAHKILYLLENQGKPMHFNEIFQSLKGMDEINDEFLSNRWKKNYNRSSIQNHLIMNPEFVWIGRGTYALKKWGYKEGNVFDRMVELVKKNKSIQKEKLYELLSVEKQFSKITFEVYIRNKKYFTIKDSIIRLSK